MIDKVFSVTGNKITSFIIDEDSLKFSSSTFETVDEFKLAFDKKLSLATKVEIKYNAIKSIKKEDNSSEISIVYKSALGISMDCEFAFTDTSKNQLFFIFLLHVLRILLPNFLTTDSTILLFGLYSTPILLSYFWYSFSKNKLNS